MKLGFTAAFSLIALLAGAVTVTASPLERNNAQRPNPNSIGNLERLNTTTIAGEVVQVRGDEFILRDATGEMLVEAESPAIRRAKLQAGDRVTIVGHYNDDGFETFSITPANGTAIYVFDD